jgi:peptidoglycan/xylan/chitin deacetylase (PgdA/CDA1 family)
LKNLAKGIGNAILGSRAVRPFAIRRLRACSNIGYYHYIGSPVGAYQAIGACVPIEQFALDLGRLEQEFDIVSLGRLLEANHAGDEEQAARRPLLAITFDDGFDLINTGAVDVLAAHGISATFFVCTACIDNRHLMWRHKLSSIVSESGPTKAIEGFNRVASKIGSPRARSVKDAARISFAWAQSHKDEYTDFLWSECDMPPLDEYLAEQRPYLTWEHLDQLLAAGHAVGLHTHTHPDCSRLTPGELKEEIVMPSEYLQARLDLDGVPFSYPFGKRVDPSLALEFVQRGVISCALGIEGCSRRGTPPYVLGRAELEEQPGLEFYGRALLSIG